MSKLSPNTEAILLLTSNLALPSRSQAVKPLTLPQYRDLAKKLHVEGRQPSDLLGEDRKVTLQRCEDACDTDQVDALLSRGLQLAQAIETWSGRAIWVRSRADDDYPAIIKQRLKIEAPPLIFGCGPIELAATGGIAIVGSRTVDQGMTEFTQMIAATAARDAVTVISGGAKGVDVTSMEASLEAGGNVVGVLADSLWRKVVSRENRDAIVEGRLLLLSPFDPESRFQVWNAMGRNKVIYALAQAGLVVNADFKKGGTWSGATEALEKYPEIPVFVRNMKSKALQALQDAGARAWPSNLKGGMHDWMVSSEFKAMATPRPKDMGGLFDGIDS